MARVIQFPAQAAVKSPMHKKLICNKNVNLQQVRLWLFSAIEQRIESRKGLYSSWILAQEQRLVVQGRAPKLLTENRRVSKRILSASMSTASCSSPKEFTQAVPPQDAVRTCEAIKLPVQFEPKENLSWCICPSFTGNSKRS